MKLRHILFLLFLGSIYIHAQEWQTIDGADYVSNGQLGGYTSWNKKFKINPYDNSIWLSRSASPFGICRIDSNGVFTLFNQQNVSAFPSVGMGDFNDFEFTSSKVLAINYFKGMYAYDGLDWQQVIVSTDVNYVTIDNDTAFISRVNGSFLKWTESSQSASSVTGCRRTVSRNGETWGTNSSFSSGFMVLFSEASGPLFHSPDTIPCLLSWNHSDFKFARNSDSLFISSDKGFSIAYNGVFIDTITPNNTINMPGSCILEFEFDSQDNIWAVFAPDLNSWTDVSHVAYLDRSTNTWSQIYDASNSPILTNSRCTIELDDQDNLWVSDTRDLYVLKLNNWPQWLGVGEIVSSNFSVYPNPVTDYLSIQNENNVFVDRVSIVDFSGKTIKELSGQSSQIDVKDIAPGIYYLRFEYDERSEIVKWIKE